MGIISAFKNRSATTLLINAAGLAGIGAVALDVHSHAKTKGAMMERRHKTDSLTSNFINNLSSDSSSAVKTMAKKRLFAFEADENVSGFFTNVKGYATGLASMLLDDAIPLGLSLGAVISKGWLSKGFGVGLLAYGGIFLAQEFFGMGKNH